MTEVRLNDRSGWLWGLSTLVDERLNHKSIKGTKIWFVADIVMAVKVPSC